MVHFRIAFSSPIQTRNTTWTNGLLARLPFSHSFFRGSTVHLKLSLIIVRHLFNILYSLRQEGLRERTRFKYSLNSQEIPTSVCHMSTSHWLTSILSSSNFESDFNCARAEKTLIGRGRIDMQIVNVRPASANTQQGFPSRHSISSNVPRSLSLPIQINHL